MTMLYLLLVLSLITIRFFAGFDSRYQKGKYISIKNRTLRILLTDEMSFFERKKRPKKDIDKMTVSGLVLYIFSLTAIIINIVLLCFVPQIPSQPWKIEATDFYMYADTVNEIISAAFIWFLFLGIIGFTAVRMITHIKTCDRKSVRIITYITSAIMLIAVAVFLIDTAKVLFHLF